MNNTTINKSVLVETANKLIEAGRVLIIAGHEALLHQLKKGNWIGGTTSYFMDTDKGGFNDQEVFVTDLTDIVCNFKIKSHEEDTITTTMLEDRYNNGFSYLILPAFSSIHQTYALEAGEQPKLFDHPIIGWVSGIHLDKIGKETPKVIDGRTGTFFENKGCVLHGELPDAQYAELDLVNTYQQDDGDLFTFQENSFNCTTCFINGQPANLADYYTEHNINVTLPLVADYAGASINIGIESVNKEEQKVSFFAPVLKGKEYKIARPVEDLYSLFRKKLPKDSSSVVLSCNCIQNYIHMDMENRSAGDFRGPFTFGEIAYILINQTMVTLTIHEQ